MIAEWHVMFTRKWLTGHVLAFGYDPEAAVWVVIDPGLHRTEVQALAPADFDRWIAEQRHLGVLRIAARQQASAVFPGLWCVGAVKRLVGLRSGALFPAGLRRDLLRAGARRAFSRDEDFEEERDRPRRPRSQGCAGA